MNARVRPMMTRMVENASVSRLFDAEYLSRGAARTPPLDEMTISGTTGSSQVAVMLSSVCLCRVNLTRQSR